MANLTQQYARFQATHPRTRRRVNGVDWEYIAAGAGADALLLLPGAPGRAEMAFEYILAFERGQRVLAVSYPAAARTMAQLAAGLAAILAAEGIGQAVVLGGSYSGWVAQALVRRQPGCVAALILSDTGVAQPARARPTHRLLRLLPLLPLPILRALLWAGTFAYVREITFERAFWRRTFHAFIRTLTRADCMGRLRCLLDFDLHYRCNPGDGARWPGRVLILESDADPLVSATERAALRACYPQAQVHTFAGSGHAGSLAHRAEYIAAIAAFLRGA